MQVLDHFIGLILRKDASTCREAELEQSGITMHRNIQRAAVIRDRHGVVVRDLCPGRVEGIGGPGTLEIRTLPAAGKRLARLKRLSSEANPVMSQGKPVIGMSTPSTGLSSLTTALAASDDAWIALKRVRKSSISVARSTRTTETWLFIALSPSARRLTGTIAISACLGSKPRSFRKRCSAMLHIAITMVFDRAAHALAYRLDVSQRQRHRAVRTLIGDRVVEYRL